MVPSMQLTSINTGKILSFARRYPIPVFAISGLLLGTICSYIINRPDVGGWIWFLTLIIGGIPVVWQTGKEILLRHHFASDIIAALAIVAAILTNEALPGVVIVIMQTGGKALEDHAFRRASSSLDELMTRSPRIAHRKKLRESNTNNDHNSHVYDQSLDEINVTDIRVL